jgi:hypothetical protein
MTSSYRVGGEYDKDIHSFDLWANDWFSAILNCTISGLTPGASYTVRLYYEYTEDDEDYNVNKDYEGKVAADGEGTATFAITAPQGDNYSCQLVLKSSTDCKVVTLGQKELEKKVYNVTATATDYVFSADGLTVSGTEARPEDTMDGKMFNIHEDPADVSISGSFEGYCFYIINGGTVKLNNVTASLDNDWLIYNPTEELDLTLVLTGNNSLSCKEKNYVLGSDKGIMLMCDDSSASATLTLTARSGADCGIYCNNFPGDGDEPDPSLLAADGYTVKLTSTVPGPDSDDDDEPDYYTWTFTVTKN